MPLFKLNLVFARVWFVDDPDCLIWNLFSGNDGESSIRECLSVIRIIFNRRAASRLRTLCFCFLAGGAARRNLHQIRVLVQKIVRFFITVISARFKTTLFAKNIYFFSNHIPRFSLISRKNKKVTIPRKMKSKLLRKIRGIIGASDGTRIRFWNVWPRRWK